MTEKKDPKRQLLGKIFLNVNYCIVLTFPCQRAQGLVRLCRIGHGECVKTESLEAHDGLSAAYNRNFKHTNHAAFPV